jgi:hypothetical protein
MLYPKSSDTCLHQLYVRTKVIVEFVIMLIGAEGARLLREAHRTARGKRSDWSEDQQASLTQPFFKINVLFSCLRRSNFSEGSYT